MASKAKHDYMADYYTDHGVLEMEEQDGFDASAADPNSYPARLDELVRHLREDNACLRLENQSLKAEMQRMRESQRRRQPA